MLIILLLDQIIQILVVYYKTPNNYETVEDKYKEIQWKI